MGFRLTDHSSNTLVECYLDFLYSARCKFNSIVLSTFLVNLFSCVHEMALTSSFGDMFYKEEF